MCSNLFVLHWLSGLHPRHIPRHWFAPVRMHPLRVQEHTLLRISLLPTCVLICSYCQWGARLQKSGPTWSPAPARSYSWVRCLHVGKLQCRLDYPCLSPHAWALFLEQQGCRAMLLPTSMTFVSYFSFRSCARHTCRLGEFDPFFVGTESVNSSAPNPSTPDASDATTPSTCVTFNQIVDAAINTIVSKTIGASLGMFANETQVAGHIVANFVFCTRVMCLFWKSSCPFRGG